MTSYVDFISQLTEKQNPAVHLKKQANKTSTQNLYLVSNRNL